MILIITGLGLLCSEYILQVVTINLIRLFVMVSLQTVFKCQQDVIEFKHGFRLFRSFVFETKLTPFFGVFS